MHTMNRSIIYADLKDFGSRLCVWMQFMRTKLETSVDSSYYRNDWSFQRHFGHCDMCSGRIIALSWPHLWFANMFAGNFMEFHTYQSKMLVLRRSSWDFPRSCVLVHFIFSNVLHRFFDLLQKHTLYKEYFGNKDEHMYKLGMLIWKKEQ